MNVSICAPSDCAPIDLAAFRVLVGAGDAVKSKGMANRVERAYRLLFLRDADGILIGVAALKRPSLSYRTRIFNEAHSTIDVSTFKLELGWVVIDRPYRGRLLPNRMVAELLPHAGKELVFATTRADKNAMQFALRQNGFSHEGVPFPSDRGGYRLILYVRLS